MKDNDLLKVQVILSSVIVLMLSLLFVVGAVVYDDVKPLISKAEAKMDSLEMPDFSSINGLISDADRVMELINGLPFDKVKDFIGVWNKLDEADITEELIALVLGMKAYYVNESVSQ